MGEHQKGREAMHKMTKDLIKSGVKPQKAQDMARKAAIRHSKNNNR